MGITTTNGGIKAIYRGTIEIIGAATYSNTATIAAVDINKSIISFLGAEQDDYGDFKFARVELTNATTVTAYRNGISAAGATTTIGYQVVEYY